MKYLFGNDDRLIIVKEMWNFYDDISFYLVAI